MFGRILGIAGESKAYGHGDKIHEGIRDVWRLGEESTLAGILPQSPESSEYPKTWSFGPASAFCETKVSLLAGMGQTNCISKTNDLLTSGKYSGW